MLRLKLIEIKSRTSDFTLVACQGLPSLGALALVYIHTSTHTYQAYYKCSNDHGFEFHEKLRCSDDAICGKDGVKCLPIKKKKAEKCENNTKEYFCETTLGTVYFPVWYKLVRFGLT